MHSFPYILIAAVVVQVLCQVFKLVFYSIRDRRLDFRYFVTAGGFPSAHSAFVTALTTLIGLRNGVGSDLFAVSFAFSLIVLYDAFRLRGEVQKQSILLNRVVDLSPHPEIKNQERPTKMIGHSIPEILGGLVAGGAFAALSWLILRSLLST